MSSDSSVTASRTELIELPRRLKRWGVRLFFILFLGILVIDTVPGTLVGAPQAKSLLSPWLNRCGLWQGQWTLFAPKPKINNSWLSAEVYAPDGTQQQFWNSTYWAETTTWERFSGFRHINYNNRIQSQGKLAADDLADYLARELISPAASAVDSSVVGPAVDQAGAWRLVLSRSELNVVLPDDGTLPTRDETLWISTSQNLTVREYQP